MTKFYREATLRIRLKQNDSSNYLPTPVLIRDLRVSFSIVKSTAWSTNSAVIKIWNLSQNTRNLLKDYGDEVTLYAGYRLETGPQVIYIGDTTVVSHIYDVPEIVTVLECGDGEKFKNQLRVSVSFGENTPAKLILAILAKDMGLAVNSFDFADNIIYRQGYKFIGMGWDAIQEICSKLNLTASIQNNALSVIEVNGSLRQPPILINENTGMQGIPQRYTYKRLNLWPLQSTTNNISQPVAQDQNRRPFTGYKVNVALNPLILPGYPLTVESRHLGIKLPCVAENVRHEGDTYGSIWSTQLEVIQLAGNIT